MKNVKLRKIEIADTNTILRWRNSKAVVSNFIDRNPLTKEIHLNWYNTKIKTGEVVQFIAIDNSNNVEFASTYLKDINQVHKKAEYGIFIGEKEYRNKGYGKLITSLTIEYAFNTLKLNKVYARVLSYNKPSYNVFLGLGFKQDAILREDVIIDGVAYDVFILSILAKDYYINN